MQEAQTPRADAVPSNAPTRPPPRLSQWLKTAGQIWVDTYSPPPVKTDADRDTKSAAPAYRARFENRFPHIPRRDAGRGRLEAGFRCGMGLLWEWSENVGG